MSAQLLSLSLSLSDENNIEIAVLPDITELTNEEGDDNEVKTSEIIIKDTPGISSEKRTIDDVLRNFETWSRNENGTPEFALSLLTSVPHQRYLTLQWCAKIKDEVEKLAYQLNEEEERTQRPIRRLSKVMYGSTCADMQVDVMGECLTSIKHVVGEQLSGGSVVVVHEEPHPQMTRYIVLQTKRNRRQTAGEIARHTTQATGRPISRFTVARRLLGGGLFARRPVRCVPLTPAHRRRRSLWYREHRNWRDNEWRRVLFTDESRFSLSSDSHRILIWRQRGSRNHPSNIIERNRYGGRGVLVWRGIMLGSRTDLHIFDAGSVNGTRYCNEILLPYVRLLRGAMGLQFLFMDDNAPCHRTVAAEQLLECLAARTLPPVMIRKLRLPLQDEWAAMPQQLIDTLILSMGRRCETCLAVREIISPTKDRMFLAGHPSQGMFRSSVALRSMLLFQSSFFLSV
ncbi:transposable element Tcb2 transposase [Trichonephila clavipes]|nr:transposable element Tcb2 transposase [Trichonephila clavipes]